MTDDQSGDAARQSDDFERWYFGGSPPESDGWERHAFEHALKGAPSVPDRCFEAVSVEGNVHRLAFAPRHSEPMAAA